MGNPERYAARFIKQMKRCALFVKSPLELVRVEKKEDDINIALIGLNILVLIVFDLDQLSIDFLAGKIRGWLISIILFMLYSSTLILWGQGRVVLNRLVNVTLYIHVIYILINVSVGRGYIHILTYVLGHIYAVSFQVLALKGLFNCKTERIKGIFYIEVGILILGLLNQIMFYVSHQIIYSSRFFHFPLLG